MTRRIRLGAFLLGVLAACSGETSGPDAAASLDAARRDVGAPDVWESDATQEIDAAYEVDGAHEIDAASEADAASVTDAAAAADSASATDAATDAALLTADASTDAAAENDCVAGGGRCVAVVPGSCASGVVGDPDFYSCGGGLGVLCCLPATTAPSCRYLGTRSEGWYRADGTLVCFASCRGARIACEAIGTRSEGWYTDPDTAACGSIPVPRLVEWADCSP